MSALPFALAALLLATSAAPLSAQAPTITGSPSLVLGSVEDGFFRIGSVDVEPESGTIVVADAGDRRVRLYGPDGEELGELGGEGDGPGEFRSVGWARVTSDGILVWDPSARRLTSFDLTGALRGTTSLAPTDSLSWPMAVGVTDSGELIVEGEAPDASADRRGRTGRIRFAKRLAVYDQQGRFRRTLMPRYLDGEVYHELVDGRVVRIPALFSSRTFVAVRSSVAVATNQGPWLSLIDPAADRPTIVRWEQGPREIPESAVEAGIERLLSGSGDARSSLAPMIRSMDVPEVFPYYDRVVLTDEGRVWVRQYLEPGASDALWRIFSDTGELVGRIRLPRQLRPWVVSGQSLIGVWTDELDVQTVRVYPVRRPEGAE